MANPFAYGALSGAPSQQAAYAAQVQQGFAGDWVQQPQAPQQPQAAPILDWQQGDYAIPEEVINKWGAGDEDRDALEVYKRAAVSVITAMAVAESKDVLLPIEMRKRGSVDPASEAIFSQTRAGILLLDMTNIVKACTDAATTKCLANLAVKLRPGGEGTEEADEVGVKKTKEKKGKKKSSEIPKLRPFFETSPAQTQCSNAIGEVVLGDSRCWICGSIINTQELEHPLRPECEHIFPVAQALCFTGLYESALYAELAAESQSSANGYVSGLAKEYAWAHRVCNQIKNDKHFIILEKNAANEPVLGTDANKISELLRLILSTTQFGGSTGRSGGAVLRDHLQLGPSVQGQEAWIATRVPQIKARSDAILGRVAALGMTVDEHAKNTIMNMRAYIARSPQCVITVEQEIKAPHLVYGNASLTLEESAADVSKKDSIVYFFVNLMGDVITDTVSQALPKTKRGADTITNVGRLLKLNANALDLGMQLFSTIKARVTPEQIKEMRLKVANHLLAKAQSGGINIPHQAYVRRLPGQVCTPDDEGKEEDDRPAYCESGAAGLVNLPLTDGLQLWSFYQQWNLGVLREFIRQQVLNLKDEYVNILERWWTENLQAAHARKKSLDAFSFEVFKGHIVARIAFELERRAPNANSFPGTTYEAIAQQPIMYQQAQFQSNESFKWFGARRRKTRKRKSKKRKTYRKKKLF